jgi:tetratricopeptide (TPR) repeat protein
MSSNSLSSEMIAELVAKADRWRQSGQRPLAAKALTSAIDVDPRNKKLHFALAETLFEGEQYQEALDTLENVDVPEMDVKQAALKGFCLEKLQRFQESEQIADQILAATHSSARAFNLKGLLMFHKRDLRGAEHYFERAVAADPEYGEARFNLGLLRLEIGEDRKALDILREGFLLSPHVKAVARTFHEIVSALGAYAEAEPIFRDACRRYSVNKRLAYLLIDILIQQNKREESMSAIEQSMAIFGVDDGILTPALKIRAALGPRVIDPENPKRGSISLCMIVKNEERHLARCLESAKDLVDEFVVVDTGSTDRTADIARAFGANLFTCKWKNDFSHARNISLSKARGQWILILDADETISGQDHEQLLNIVGEDSIEPCAFKLITRNYTADAGAEGWQPIDDRSPRDIAGNGWYPSEKVRLFPRDNRIFFENTVHELVEPSLRRAGIAIKKCVVPIHHYGTLDRKTEAKKKAGYYILGKGKMADNPQNPAALVENAVQAQEVGDYQRALDLWKSVLEHLPNLPKAYFNLSYIYIQLEQYHHADQAAQKAMELDPNLKEAVINHALCQIRIGNIEQAAERLEQFLIQSPDHPLGKGLLAVAWCIMEKKRDGLKLLSELQETGYDCSKYILDHAQKMATAGRHLESGKLLQAIADGPFADTEFVDAV